MQSTRVTLAFAISILVSVSPSMASAAGSTSLVISEVMTGSSDNAGNEFIELYNPTSQAVLVTGWSLEYKSATSADMVGSWTKRSSLNGSVAPHGFFLVAPKTMYTEADADWSATLAASGGHIRLKDDKGTVVDLLGYGAAANAAEILPAVAPQAGQSIERLPGRVEELSGNGTDTNNNALDFVVRQSPLPQSSKSAIELPGTVVPEVPIPTDEGVAMVLPLMLSELLPNPAAPLTDAEDEFIEIFNPNEVAVNYGGYKLKGGSDFHTGFTLPAGSINPGQYMAFTSSKTHIGLTNSGGAVQLLDPDGALLDQTAVYGAATDGRAWARVGDSWEWTLQPTPGAENVVMTPPVAVPAAASTSKPTSSSTPKLKAVTTGATETKKPSATKVEAKPKVTVAKKKSSGPVQVAAAQLRPVTWLIITLTLLTIGYAIYEFRHDLQNYYYKLRGNRQPRPETIAAPERGRDD